MAKEMAGISHICFQFTALPPIIVVEWQGIYRICTNYDYTREKQ